MSVNLRDQVIVIAGASSGIGAAAAEACARAGMHLTLGARRVERLEEVAGRVRAVGRRAVVAACDVRRDDDVQRLVDSAVREFGRLDAMLANAGYGLYAAVADTTDAQMRDIFETNYYGTLRCVHAALPVMRRQGRGHLLIMSSAASEVAPPMYGAYAATKAAQDAIACALRAELHDEGIAVTSIHPVGTYTEFFQRVADLSPQASGSPNTPVVLRQTAEYVARRVVGALRRRPAELWPSFATRLGVGFAAALPDMAAWGLRRHMRQHHLQPPRPRPAPPPPPAPG